MRTMQNASCRADLIARIRRLQPDSPRRWGSMGAPQMIAHLTDQMGHTLGDVSIGRIPSVLALPVVRELFLYVLPWPRGRVKGPAAAFVTQPLAWEGDVARLIVLVERFGACNPTGAWPDHAFFGRMTGRSWGVFCYRHFDHHLQQFGV